MNVGDPLCSPGMEYWLTSLNNEETGMTLRKSDGLVVPMKGRTIERKLRRSFWREGVLGDITLNRETYVYNRD